MHSQYDRIAHLGSNHLMHWPLKSQDVTVNSPLIAKHFLKNQFQEYGTFFSAIALSFKISSLSWYSIGESLLKYENTKQNNSLSC